MARPVPDPVCADGLSAHLSRNSAPYFDPLDRIRWELLDTDSFWLPEAAVSLSGIGEFDALPLWQRQRVSQMEFLNVIQVGIWVENIFIERIARSLRRPPPGLDDHRYLLHEIREEAGHSLMFLELVHRSGLPRLPVPGHGLTMAALIGRHAPYRWLGFWLAVTIGEEIPDRLNRYLRKYGESVNPAVRDLVTAHVVDEARHIAYARCRLQNLLEGCSGLHKRALQPCILPVLRQFVRAFYFPGPEVYRAAGLDNAPDWARRARTSPGRRDFVDQCVNPVVRGLEPQGLRLTWR